ncbi:MAG: DUF1211 domain-containing protein [Armatimonadetes bacterium]|nr:DUF1211 domain-containing protein [Armatimonadota bacterium]
MGTSRLEAFSDGVLAIIITIMVLELRPPEYANLESLRSMWPVGASYIISFVMIGIYWNNHHNMLQASQRVGGAVLWANLHLLFWLSIVPFGTAWMGETRFQSLPVAIYGFILLMCGASYFLLSRALIAKHGRDSALGQAFQNSFKDYASVLFYVASIPLAFVHPAISIAIFVAVAAMWLIPDRRMERAVDANGFEN